MITLTVAILTGSLVGRPVKNGDAHLKHTAAEKTAAVPVAEAESTKVLPRSALRHRGKSLESPPGGGGRAHESAPPHAPCGTVGSHSRSPPGGFPFPLVKVPGG